MDNTDNDGGKGSRKIMIMIKCNPAMAVRHSHVLTDLMRQPFTIMLKCSLESFKAILNMVPNSLNEHEVEAPDKKNLKHYNLKIFFYTYLILLDKP